MADGNPRILTGRALDKGKAADVSGEGGEAGVIPRNLYQWSSSFSSFVRLLFPRPASPSSSFIWIFSFLIVFFFPCRFLWVLPFLLVCDRSSFFRSCLMGCFFAHHSYGSLVVFSLLVVACGTAFYTSCTRALYSKIRDSSFDPVNSYRSLPSLLVNCSWFPEVT